MVCVLLGFLRLLLGVGVCVLGCVLLFFFGGGGGACIAVFVFIGVLFVEADDRVNTR